MSDAFINAAKDGDLSTVQSLVDKVNINSRHFYLGFTALWQAASAGHLDVVEFLVARKDVDVNLVNVDGQSPLLRAALNGHEAVVTVLLSYGADVNQADDAGQSPLYVAAINGHDAVVTVLLSHGADVNQADTGHCSPLLYAASEGHDAVVALLLSHGADVNQLTMDGLYPIDVAKNQKIKDMIIAHTNKQSQWLQAAKDGDLAVIQQGINDKIDVNCRDSEGRTALWQAADEGHLDVVQFVVARKDVDVNLANVDGQSPLLRAALNGHDAVVAILLSHGADVNKANKDGWSPLYIATRGGKDAMVTILLSHGADVNQANNNGLKPIDYANQKIKDMLIAHAAEAEEGELGGNEEGEDNEDDEDVDQQTINFIKAAKDGDLNTVQSLVDKVNINSQNSVGYTALWQAASAGHLDVVQFLVARKDVDVNLADNDRWSPLCAAASKGHDAVVTVLLSHGADVNQANKNGQSPLYIAAINGHDAVVAILLSHGADVNKANNNGWSPLYTAAYNDNDAVVAILLYHGANINQADKYGWSPLYAAAQWGRDDVVTVLLSHGADVNQADKNGESPLYAAAINGHDAVVTVLLSHEADVNQANNDGNKPIDVANQKIKDMLIAHNNKQLPQQPSSPALDDATITTIIFSLLDEIVVAFVEEDLPKVLMQLAEEKGEKPWGRSTVIFVGAGRAGKTGTERSMLGYAFEHTESTVGINNEYMFEVTSELANVDGNAHVTGESRWLLEQKAEKEYESALAKLASAIQQGKVNKDNNHNVLLEQQKVVEQKAKLDAMKKNLVKEKKAASATVKVASSSSSSSSSSSPATAQPSVPSSVAINPLSTTAAGNDNGDNYDSLIQEEPLSTVPQDVDLEYALRMLAKDKQMNSKLLLTFLDFGGQKAFESINQFFMVEQAVYVAVFNMECFLTLDDRIPVNPEKGITTWSECLKVALHWLNTVVVHTMPPGSTKPAPIFIVGTHKDTVPSHADHQAISEALMAALGVDNPVLNNLQRNDTEGLCFYAIDNTLGRSDRTMHTLMKRIEAVIETQDYVKKLLPLLWFRVLDWLNAQPRHYLTYDEVAKHAKECGFDMSTTRAVDDMLSMFHECSVLMWHNVDGLRHIVILDPISFFVAHATNLLRQHTGTATDATQHKLPKLIEDKIQSNTLLRSDFAQMIATGIITQRLLDVLLFESEEPRVVVQLMITYALLVPLRREEAEVVSGGGSNNDTILLRYLVPALLPDGINDKAGSADGHHFYLFFAFTGMISDDCLLHRNMRDKGFLPGGLFARLIARLLGWSQDTTTARTWSCDKESMTLFFGNQRFCVTHRPYINAIEVSMFDRHTPLAIHARLKHIVEVLIAECFHCLSMVTLVEHHGDAPMQGAVRPSSGMRWLTPLPAIRQRVVFMSGGSQGMRKLTAMEVETGFAPWLVRTGVSDVLMYDLFFSHRWDWNDKLFVRKLVDLLAQFTTGVNPPRAIVSFLDVDSLEDGLNFQEAFVGGLVRTSLMVFVISWAALERMKTLDATAAVDNVLVEWICALRLLHLKRILVMPVFFGKRTDANGVGGSFFERDADTGLTILQQLPDSIAETTLAMAVELMTKSGVWTSGSVVEPSAFGLSSLSVRAIVTAMTSQMGIQACDSKTPAQLLRSCADKITSILNKGAVAGGGGGGMSMITTTVAPSSPAAASAGGGANVNGGMSPQATVDVSGAVADQQAKSEEIMFQWLLTHTPGIPADSAHIYAHAFVSAKILTIPRLAKKVSKESGFLLSLGVDQDDAEDIVQAMGNV